MGEPLLKSEGKEPIAVRRCSQTEEPTDNIYKMGEPLLKSEGKEPIAVRRCSQTEEPRDNIYKMGEPHLKSDVQGYQLNMAVYFWYLVKSDLSSVYVYSSVHWASHLLQGTRKIRPCLNGHPVGPV